MNINKVIDDAPFGRFYISLFSLSLLIMILEGVDIQIIGFVAPLMIKEWGIPSADFGIVFSSGLAGAMVGAMLLGSLGDRVGRRPLIIWSMILFGVGTLLTPLVPDITTLVILRFVTSLGLGGVVPNIISLCAELAPSRFRASFVGTVATSQLVGGVVGGIVSSWLIDDYGWQVIFYLAGGLSVLTLIPVYFILPESLRFMVQSGKPAERIEALIKRIGVDDVSVDTIQMDRTEVKNPGTINLFREGRALMTSLLWLAIAFNLFMTAFIIYWLPTLLVELGVALPTAITSITVMNAAGIIGGVSISFAIGRFGPFRVLGLAYFISALAVSVIGFTAPDVLGVMVLVFIAGFLALGGFAGINLLAATLYPTKLRSAGVGGAVAASKGGAIVGPLAAGAGLAANVPLTGVFMISAAGGLVACLAIFLLARVHHARSENSVAGSSLAQES
jgi:AAHS family 4-hydroxybenzoate transporter-like MFS transporter